MRTCVIFNPKARGQKAERLQSFLKKVTSDCHCLPTQCAGEARRLASTAVEEGFENIIAAGGDGTINEVVNGIGDVVDGFSRGRLGILPMGTINVFARELNLPPDLESAWQTIQRGNEIRIDLPRAEFRENDQLQLRYFVQLAGAGLDASAVAGVDWELKKKIGAWAYVVAGMKALNRTQARVTVSGNDFSVTGELVLVGNGRLYGGDFILFPEADWLDGELEISIFPRVNWSVLLRAGIGLATHRLHELCSVQRLKSDWITLSAETETCFQLDGENVGKLPARFFVEPKRLRVIVP